MAIMNVPVATGDLAVYRGAVKNLKGRSGEVGQYTATQKRVRVAFRLEDGVIVTRLIHPTNLTTVAAGVVGGQRQSALESK